MEGGGESVHLALILQSDHCWYWYLYFRLIWPYQIWSV